MEIDPGRSGIDQGQAGIDQGQAGIDQGQPGIDQGQAGTDQGQAGTSGIIGKIPNSDLIIGILRFILPCKSDCRPIFLKKQGIY